MHPDPQSTKSPLVVGVILFTAICVSACCRNDDFGKDIVIPSGMKVEEPIDFKPAWGQQHDEEAGVIDDTTYPGSAKTDAINNVDLPMLEGNKRELLLRHLATSCRWRVSEERGRVFAIRREVDNYGNWISDLNGYIYRPIEPSGHVSVRTVIGIDGPVYTSVFHTHEFTAKHGLVNVPVSESVNHEHESYFCDRFGSHVLEIFEESPSMRRKFTDAELHLVKVELDRLNASTIAASQGFDPSLMPAFSVGRGQPDMKLIKSEAGGGIYFVDAFVNAGEPGKTFLKVFEATRNTKLSEASVSKDSLEYVGWSDNRYETFFYESLICIDEGNWQIFYPARFELWFQPSDRSKPERKLLERTYKICGWQR